MSEPIFTFNQKSTTFFEMIDKSNLRSKSGGSSTSGHSSRQSSGDSQLGSGDEAQKPGVIAEKPTPYQILLQENQTLKEQNNCLKNQLVDFKQQMDEILEQAFYEMKVKDDEIENLKTQMEAIKTDKNLKFDFLISEIMKLKKDEPDESESDSFPVSSSSDSDSVEIVEDYTFQSSGSQLTPILETEEEPMVYGRSLSSCQIVTDETLNETYEPDASHTPTIETPPIRHPSLPRHSTENRLLVPENAIENQIVIEQPPMSRILTLGEISFYENEDFEDKIDSNKTQKSRPDQNSSKFFKKSTTTSNLAMLTAFGFIAASVYKNL